MSSYEEFLETRHQYGADQGFAPIEIPSAAKDFQATLIDWALRKGRGMIAADCGLGKTLMELVWGDNVVRHTNKPVLLLAPLAVASQTIREAAKFGVDAARLEGGTSAHPTIVITNYQKLHHFDPKDFAGVICDESSILKSFDGSTRLAVTEFMRTIPYRLLATATAAPNDYIELGTSSEALGEMGQIDMLGRFFKNDQNTSTAGGQRKFGKATQWRFKGHSEESFWKWICHWARACRKPSDLGFSDAGYDLPALTETEHVIESATFREGLLFAMAARDMREEREERRRTINERCMRVSELVDHDQPAVVWCHLNDESKLLARMLPDFAEVSGEHSDEEKERAFDAFATGEKRGIITKAKIAGFGLNWQHCAHVVTFASHSYEQYYQSVRRCWRFGQTRPVQVDIVCSEGEIGIKNNLRRKAENADRMFTALVANMNQSQRIAKTALGSNRLEIPKWL